jgi:inorganic triphosphatase YgiF
MTGTPSDAPIELEVKLLLPPGAETTVLDHPALRGRSEVRHEVSTYYDTGTWDLARAGAVLRIRQGPLGRVQTLKLTGKAAFGRNEWEWPIDSDHPVLGQLADTPIGAQLPPAQALQPVFTTEVDRAVRTIDRGDAVIEVALDLGRILAGDAVEEIRELELELKDGKPLPLYQLAAELHGTIPLVLGSESKSDRGLRLRTGRARKAVKQGQIDLPTEVTGREGFRRIVDSVLGNFLANLPAAASGDIEGVHQMRIAIRRLRSVLVLFGPYLAAHAAARFGVALRELGRILGKARDWDVFCTEALEHVRKEGVSADLLDLLRGPAELARSEAHSQVEAALRKPLLTATVLGLAAWVEDPVALTGREGEADLDLPLANLGPALEARLARKVLRRGRHICRRDVPELHELRKSLKKLRYGVELLSALQEPKEVKPFLRGSKALLKRLGRINDAGVAIALAEELGGERKPELAPAVAVLAAWAERRRAKSRRQLRESWREFRDVPLPH